jgi:hypothetical protein
MKLRLFTLLAALATSVTTTAGESLAPQKSSQSGVVIRVTPRVVTGPVWEFDVALDTHSQDLSDDLATSAQLAADGGAPTKPSGWQGDPPGGHHRKGVLRFNAPKPAPAAIALRIQRTGEPAPRVFRWSLR